MKQLLLLSVASFLSAGLLFALKKAQNDEAYSMRPADATYNNRVVMGCSPDLSTINFSDSATLIPLLKGWGTYRMPVTHKNDSAYTYFQQGINMYYGFHIIEALASFEKAIRLDPDFAMAYWAKALAYGPNINDIGYAASPEALEAMQQAEALSGTCTPVEKALIAAMQVRYSADSTQKREFLNAAYGKAMQKVYSRFPQSADAAALYADALMVQHPWDLYDGQYNPKPWTPEIVQVLEGIVHKFPTHPGASHYYIHAIEGSKTPEKGLAVANRLGAMMPGVAHLVHMPSHIYIRSGQYDKGVRVNLDAVKGYYENLRKFPVTVNNAFLYLVHNLHMQAACALMAAHSERSMQYAVETQKSFDSAQLELDGYFGMYSQYLYLTPLFTKLRFGKWDEILNQPAFPASQAYAAAMGNFGRGMAQARNHRVTEARQARALMNGDRTSNQLLDHPAAFNPGMTAVQLAQKILEGVIEEEQGNLKASVALLSEAVALEDAMLYNEPRDWLLPARQYLGRVLLKAKEYAAAVQVYREDLKINPNNIWSLTGLYQALKSSNRKLEAATVRGQLEKAQSGSDVKITASAF